MIALYNFKYIMPFEIISMAIYILYFDVIDRQTTITKIVFCIQIQYKKIPYLDTVYMVVQKP